jgi:hypothetical protein
MIPGEFAVRRVLLPGESDDNGSTIDWGISPAPARLRLRDDHRAMLHRNDHTNTSRLLPSLQAPAGGLRFVRRIHLLLLFVSSPLRSAEYPEPTSGDHTLRDFRFASGERLAERRFHYRTLGEPERSRCRAPMRTSHDHTITRPGHCDNARPRVRDLPFLTPSRCSSLLGVQCGAGPATSESIAMQALSARSS